MNATTEPNTETVVTDFLAQTPLFIITRRVLSLLIKLQILISNHIKITLTAAVPEAKDIYALQDIRPFAKKFRPASEILSPLQVYLSNFTASSQSSRNSHIPSVLI